MTSAPCGDLGGNLHTRGRSRSRSVSFNADTGSGQNRIKRTPTPYGKNRKLMEESTESVSDNENEGTTDHP